MGREGNRPDRQAEGHPLRRKLAEDPLGQDHAPIAALDRKGRGNHPGRLDAREPGHPRSTEAGVVNDVRAQRFVALAMLGTLLFNYPVLALFNVSGTLAGVPVLYAYIFIAWAALIALMAFVAE